MPARRARVPRCRSSPGKLCRSNPASLALRYNVCLACTKNRPRACPMNFKLASDYQPCGDQPGAISQLVKGIANGDKHQVLLGVTGSGKTFTVAKVINELNRPALVLAHNKTLAAQLFNEFRNFF